MSRKSEIVNKIKSGVNRLTRTSGAANSELDSELVTKNIAEINQKFKERSIKAKLFVKQNYLYIRGTYSDSKGIRKERKIPLRLTTDISNLVSAEARVLQFVEYINKNGFIGSSGNSYKRIYPAIAEAVEKEEVTIQYIDLD